MQGFPGVLIRFCWLVPESSSTVSVLVGVQLTKRVPAAKLWIMGRVLTVGSRSTGSDTTGMAVRQDARP